MKYVRLIRFVTVVLSTLGLTAMSALASVKPGDQAFRPSVLLDEKDRHELRWSVAPGALLYRGRISVALNGTLKFKTWHAKTNTIQRWAQPRSIIARLQLTSTAPICRSGRITRHLSRCRENTVLYSSITKSIALATFFISDDVTLKS
jgi:hypothetical protein